MLYNVWLFQRARLAEIWYEKATIQRTDVPSSKVKPIILKQKETKKINILFLMI